VKVQELLKVPSPENRLMLLQLGMNETARSLVVEALSHAENYPLILKYLGEAHNFVGSLSAPVAVEKELVDPMFYVTATIWCTALDDPCIFKSAWDADITLEDNVPLTPYGEKTCRSGCFVFSSLLVGTDGMERAEKVQDDIISIVASNGADAVHQYKRAVESRLAYISESDDLYARQENILLMRDKERLDSLLSQ
jgi:hypothetical protein